MSMVHQYLEINLTVFLNFKPDKTPLLEGLDQRAQILGISGHVISLLITSSKILKIVKNGQNQDFWSRFQSNQSTYNQTFNVYCKNFLRSCYKKKGHDKYLKLTQICTNNLENHQISFTPCGHQKALWGRQSHT